MYLCEEFYDNFKGYDINKVNQEVDNLCEKDKINLLRGYSLDRRKKSKTSDDVVLYIKKRLSKKDLFHKLRTDDRNKVNLLLNGLTKKERNCLFKEYYIDYIEPKVSLTNKERKNNTRIISKMWKELGTYGIGSGRKTYKPYYEVFEGFTKEEVDHIFLYNTEEEKELIYKKYGRDFSNTEYREDVTDEENEIINSKILHTMKRRLMSLRKGVSCYVRITDLIDVDLETLRVRSRNLTKKVEYNRLVKYFGENLDKEAYITTKLKENIINDNMREVLLGKEKEKKIVKPSYRLIDLLREARKENETDEAFLIRIRRINNTLEEETQKVMFKKYGLKLNEVHDEKDFTREERYNIIHIYVPTIKYRLMHEEKQTFYIKPFFERFPGVMREIVLKGVEGLTENEKQFLNLIFGEKLDKTITFDESNPKISSTINSIVKKVKVNILEDLKRETGILVMYLKEIEKECQLDTFKEIENTYGLAISEGIICYLKYRDVIDDESLKKFTGLTYNDVKNLLVTDMNILRKATLKK